MNAPRTYLTTTIPYVNARPHLGFALELVQADVLARHRRLRGEQVRLLGGTDDNSLKNVLAAEAAGLEVAEFVDRNAAAFEALHEPLAISLDDFIRTSRDPRHAAGVAALWRRCAAAGDLYRKHYEGLYCVGCEQFYTPGELVDGRCAEHGTEPQTVAEENWFFRLSRYTEPLRAAIAEGRLRIEPAARRNEVLALLDGGLHDFSISRSHTRARGWGIPVPGDPEQVVYVWWDALGNYLTGLGYGSEDRAFQDWWLGSERRVHLVGKGVLRFHAVYWPAMLLSAGLPLPTDVLVHDYLTVDGRKISKSAGNVVDPTELVDRYGTDAVRWWLLREVAKVGDTDFTVERLVARADADLAGGLGNLVNRVVTMVHRYRDGRGPELEPAPEPVGDALLEVCRAAPGEVTAALDAYDFRRATAAAWRVLEAANRTIDQRRPWELARSPESADLLDATLATLLHACRTLAALLTPFVPQAARAVAAQCTAGEDGRLPDPKPLFARLAVIKSGVVQG
ncbi:methionine--tRNA ligase [Kitasatospora sp. NBC_01266]|uniref:methionine--tRNA ligase n=1 Tax=Kitasatospora sp. NBC_01266 TaxID=2903572 RepID=UPI002E31204B|nr:methionine--tRNA ligase [Kitasatospora sp. NBC_01266]